VEFMFWLLYLYGNERMKKKQHFNTIELLLKLCSTPIDFDFESVYKLLEFATFSSSQNTTRQGVSFY